MNPHSGHKDNRSGWLSLCISYTLVTTPLNVSPILTVAIMSGLSLAADRAGLVLTIELVCLALTAAILSPLASRFSIKKVLRKAIKKGGSSINDYINANGKSGYFQYDFKVYGRTSLPCHNCQSDILQVKINQRSSFYCKNCQK